MTSLHTCTSAIHPEKVIHTLFLSFKCNPHPRVRLNLGCLSPKNSHVDDSVLNHLRQNVLHAHCAIYSQCVCCACLHFIGRIYMQPVMYSYFCSFSSTTVAGTCIVAGLPRCLPSTMQNATSMTVTLSNEQHAVLFSATWCEPGKQCSEPNCGAQ